MAHQRAIHEHAAAEAHHYGHHDPESHHVYHLHDPKHAGTHHDAHYYMGD